MGGFPAAALVQAGGQIVSSIFNRQKERSPRQQILSTVKGAREAGIHPLAALGAGAGYSYSSGSPIGSAIGEGIKTLGRGMENQKSQAEIDAIRANTRASNAQAQLFEAQSRSIMQRAASAARGNPQTPGHGVPLPRRDTERAKPVKFFGTDLYRDRANFASGQRASDEFGEIGEFLTTLPSFIWSQGRAANREAQWLEDRLRNYQFNKGRYAK